jgi:hypothetical protein
LSGDFSMMNDQPIKIVTFFSAQEAERQAAGKTKF